MAKALARDMPWRAFGKRQSTLQEPVMLELLCILAILLYIVWRLNPKELEDGASSYELATAALAEPSAAEAPRYTMQLAIAGTQRADLGHRKFVKSFGMNPQAVHDLRTFSHSGDAAEVPATIRSALLELHDRGCALGSDVMGLLFHGRGLKASEAIYFALLVGKPEPRIVAFIDQQRA
jgi:hypothetical protein